MQRHCAACSQSLDHEDFSYNQWRKGAGISRCRFCVEDGYQPGYDTSSRVNNATRALIDDMDRPFAEGRFRWVAKGIYNGGQRAGQPCVGKWFKSGVVYEAEFYESDLRAMERATDLVRRWNSENIVNQQVRINQPQVWTINDGGPRHGQKVLVEPFIEDYVKFNSNSGWVPSHRKGPSWVKAMQALSHFSYHASGGHFVVCDLQGGIYRNGVVLTDPVVLSRTRMYGVTDLGPEGISSFFARHQCNMYCRAHWTRPKDTTAYFPAEQSTSMMLRGARTVPHHYSRPQLSQIYEDVEYYSSDSDEVSYGLAW